MSLSYKVQRTIQAAPERIWELLTDSTSYAAWNPTVVSLEGRIAAGETIKLVSTVNPKRTFSLKVTELDGPRRMVWSDGMPLGLFKGVRTYSLSPTDAGSEFEMEEVYSGPLAPLITRAIPDLTDSFAQFADGLKAASEARSASGSA
jgi:uncharacterized protein YndB with AHSA1/START domain